MSVPFEVVAEIFPETNDKNLNLVILGYSFCPYSKMTLAALEDEIAQGEKYMGGHTVFVSFDERSDPKLLELRREARYDGTMPVIFMRDAKSRKMSHLGGANEFMNHLKKKKSSR